jgi:hypothetical protein
MVSCSGFFRQRLKLSRKELNFCIKTLAVNANLQKTFDTLERQRAQLAAMLKDVPTDRYLKSTPGAWSVAQVISHLITSERLSLIYMRKKALGIEGFKDSGFRQAAVFVLLKISQRIPFRYKAPKAVVENTPDGISKEEAFAQWDKARQDLNNFLNSIADQHSRRLIFKHPVAGMLDVRQSVAFMYEHVRHHLPQIKRLLNR